MKHITAVSWSDKFTDLNLLFEKYDPKKNYFFIILK